MAAPSDYGWGTGLGTLRVAAKHADRLNVIASPEKCAELIRLLEAMRQEAGQTCDDIEFSVHTTLALAGRDGDAEAYAGRVAASHGVKLAELRDTWLIGARPPSRPGSGSTWTSASAISFSRSVTPLTSHHCSSSGTRCSLHCRDGS